ncbi:hypothetical protein CF65_02630 [Aggregatibacter actinomycetemcomitans HK1651]|nr:hypothetical protein CF65_02630 [Aggregatibacter actinomycetemcomitans HK1651]
MVATLEKYGTNELHRQHIKVRKILAFKNVAVSK